jgi:uncharacterized membrane protein YdbT with pleckstrin-like domain
MSYVEQVLEPGETVKFIGRLHWTIYRNAIALGAVAGIAILALHNATLALVLLAIAVAFFIHAWFVRATSEIVVTDKRIIHKVGWIARRTQEMNVTKVETVDVKQSIWGRIFGFGTVCMIGTGSSWEPLRFIATPLQLRKAISVG